MDRQSVNCCGARVDCAGCDARPLALCGALAPADIGVMAAIAHPRKIEAGKQLIQEGDPAEDVFTLTDGMLKLYKLMPDGRRQITGFMIPGDFIGLAYGQSYIYSAEAVVQTHACRFRRSALLERMAEHPELEHRLLGLASNELAAAQSQMLLLGRKSARERLASFLVGLAERRQVAEGEAMSLPMSRSDIADFLGLTIETVSRVFTAMRKDRLISLPDKHSVKIVDLEALKDQAGD
jgi:CRP/FNR family transcriptional regulator, anaerobic regulatory protein